MTLELIDIKNLMLDNSISELRNIPEYVAMCNAHVDGLTNVQNVVNYLSDAINVYKAQGIWLDYIGWLVGIKRSYRDIGKFFSVNASDLNVEKYFWFAQGNVDENSNLDDEIYRRKILGKILYNKSKCTRNENIAIIKYMTNAEHCIITKLEALLCDITLYGDDIVETISLKDEIESLLGEGCGIRNLTIRSSSDYE